MGRSLGRLRLMAGVAFLFVLPGLSAQKVSEPVLRPDRQPSFLSGFRLPGSLLNYGEYVTDVVVDRKGFIYAVGSTFSEKLPTSPNAYQRVYGGCDRFKGCFEMDGYIFKLDPSGTTLLAATYFGGPDREDFHRVLVDSEDNVIVVGSGPLLPLTPDAPFATGNDFILKFDSDLSHILYATRWPSPPTDIVVDDEDRIYLSGGAPFGAIAFAPVRSSYEHPCARDRYCGYVARLEATGRRVEVVARFPAMVLSLRLAKGGGVWVAGYGSAEWADLEPDRLDQRFPRPYASFWELFIGKLSADLQELSAQAVLPERRTWQSFLDPKIKAMTLDPSGNLYLTGSGRERLPITSNAVQRTSLGGTDYSHGNGDGFLTVVRATGELQYSTWIGTERVESGQRVVVDDGGTAWVLGAMAWSQVNPPCLSWVVGIDPRRKGKDSLRYSACSNDAFGGGLDGGGRMTLSPEGNLIIAALSKASTIGDLTTQPGIRVYRLDASPDARLRLSSTTPTVVRTHHAWAFETKLENIGHDDAVDTVFEGQLPLQNYTFIRMEATQGWCSDVTFRCELGVLPPGSSAVVRVLVKDNSINNEFTFSQFEAQATWMEAGSSRYNWRKEHPPATFEEVGDLELTVEGYQPVVRQGESVRYWLTVRNLGPDSASAVRLQTNLGDLEMNKISHSNPCYAGQCLFRTMRAGEQVQVEIVLNYPQVGPSGIHFVAHRSAEHPKGDPSGDPNRLNDTFILPIDVVGESPPATVLAATVLEKYVLSSSRVSIELLGKNFYATSTGYWDGKPRKIGFSWDGRAFLTLLTGDLGHGHHKTKVCSPAAGCSNELEVVIEKNAASTPVPPRMSMRLENGITSTPYAGPRRFVRPVDETEERRKNPPGIQDP